MKGFSWSWQVRLRLFLLVLIVGGGIFSWSAHKQWSEYKFRLKKVQADLENFFSEIDEARLQSFAQTYFQFHPELIGLELWDQTGEKVFSRYKDVCVPLSREGLGFKLWNCRSRGKVLALKSKVEAELGRRTILAIYQADFLPPFNYWKVMLPGISFLILGFVLSMLFSWRIIQPIQQIVNYFKTGFSQITADLSERSEPRFLAKALALLRKELTQKNEHITKVQKMFRNWRRVQNQKYKNKIKHLEKALNQTETQLYNLVENLKPSIRHILQMSRLLYVQASDKLPVEMEGRFLILMREAEQCRDQLLELEEALELKRDGEKSKNELVSLQELVFDLKNELKELLENYQAQIKLKTTLPSIYCRWNWLHQLFKGLIEELLTKSEGIEKPIIEIGYNNLNDRLLFYLSLLGEKKQEPAKKDSAEEIDLESEEDISKASSTFPRPSLVAIVENYGGELWEGENEQGNGIIFFTLSKHRLSPANGEQKAA